MTASELRQWRERHNLTRKEAAALLGVSWRSVEAWELGRKIPQWIEVSIRRGDK